MMCELSTRRQKKNVMDVMDCDRNDRKAKDRQMQLELSVIDSARH
jgi:hypothetical protein